LESSAEQLVAHSETIAAQDTQPNREERKGIGSLKYDQFFFSLLPPIVISIQCSELLSKQAFLDACGSSEKN
jgi:hypothetical protein